MSFDWDADACESYERNVGSRPIQIDVRELLRAVRAGWRPTERVDLLVADPPCAPWSRTGSGLGTYDERDLVEKTVEFIRLLRPRAHLIANVPGLDDGPNWHVVQRTIGERKRRFESAA
jgi:site-specific DNA-cytosine methylase